PALLVTYPFVVQAPLADVTKQVVNLVEGQDRSSRVVDRRRKALGGDVHDDAKGKRRVLLQGALLAHGDRLDKPVGGQTGAASEYVDQGIAARHEVTDLGHELNDTIGASGQRDEPRNVECEHDTVPGARDRVRGASVEVRGWRRRRARRIGETPRVDALDNVS